MALVDTVRSAVATIHNIVQSFEAEVQHAVWVSADEYGKNMYGRVVEGVAVISHDPYGPNVAETRTAIVELEQKAREVNGRTIVTHAHLTFLVPFGPTEVKPTPDRKEPVDPRDFIILPDGTYGPIVDIKGFVDAGTKAPFFVEVWLGAIAERGTLL